MLPGPQRNLSPFRGPSGRADQPGPPAAVPGHLRGRIMGVWMIVYSGAVPLGSLWAGELANRHGVAAVLELSAALCLGACGLAGGLDLLGSAEAGRARAFPARPADDPSPG